VQLLDAEDILRELEEIAQRRGWPVQGELGPEDVEEIWRRESSETLVPFFAWELCVALRYTLRWWGTIVVMD
jgi:hypothetical protein